MCDDSVLAPLVAKYTQMKDKVKDLTDTWVGAMRTDDSKRKEVKRKAVKLSSLPGGLPGMSDTAAQEHFGAGVAEVDEMEFSLWKMGTLLADIRKEQEAARGKVCPCRSSCEPLRSGGLLVS